MYYFKEKLIFIVYYTCYTQRLYIMLHFVRFTTRAAARTHLPSMWAQAGMRAMTTAVQDEDNSKNVMLHLANISEELGTSFQYPKVVVVGNQSSGKSSVLEAIVGKRFLPTGNNMVTRRPIEITLLRDPSMTVGFKARFGAAGRVITSLTDIHDELTSRNMGNVVNDPIYLTISSPNVHNLTIVDLPGFIRVTKSGEDDNLPDVIRDMCLSYIHNPTFIKLIVMAATNDRALSMGLEEVKRAHQFHNAFGVLTKMDMVVKKDKSREDLIAMLRDKDYLPGLGLVGVKLHSKEEISEGRTIEDMIDDEKEFITKYKLDKEADLHVGVPLLREVLSREQLKRIAAGFPNMISQIENKIITEQENSSLLQNLAAMPDLRPISGEVKKLVTSLHPLSPMRGDFEADLEKNLGALVRTELERSIANNIPLEQPKDLEASLGTQNNNGSGSSFEQTSFFNHVRSAYDGINGTMIDKAKKEDFKRLTILGESDPQMDEKELHEITKASFAASAVVPFYRWSIPKDFQRRRVAWNENLSFVIEDLLDVNELAEKSRKYCIDQILEFVEREADRRTANSGEVSGDLAKGFFRYILGQIADRTDQENLTESIRQMVAREKRPLADLACMSYGAHAVSKLPFNQQVGFFGTEHFPAFMNIYGNIWNHAYVNQVLVPRVQTDVFRIIAVNLLDPLILDTIEQSLKFFQHKDFDRDQKAVIDKIDRLNHYIDILKQASENYQPVSDFMEQAEKHVKEEQKNRRGRIATLAKTFLK